MEIGRNRKLSYGNGRKEELHYQLSVLLRTPTKISQKLIQIFYSNLKQARNNFRHGITMIVSTNYLSIYYFYALQTCQRKTWWDGNKDDMYTYNLSHRDM